MVPQEIIARLIDIELELSKTVKLLKNKIKHLE